MREKIPGRACVVLFNRDKSPSTGLLRELMAEIGNYFAASRVISIGVGKKNDALSGKLGDILKNGAKQVFVLRFGSISGEASRHRIPETIEEKRRSYQEVDFYYVAVPSLRRCV